LACLSRHIAATIVLAVAGGICSLIVLAVGVYDWNQVTSAGVTAGSGLTLTALAGVAGLVSCGLPAARHQLSEPHGSSGQRGGQPNTIRPSD
jgi:hypothetical protein